jgi:hypothetical protein
LIVVIKDLERLRDRTNRSKNSIVVQGIRRDTYIGVRRGNERIFFAAQEQD